LAKIEAVRKFCVRNCAGAMAIEVSNGTGSLAFRPAQDPCADDDACSPVRAANLAAIAS
jgi:hypothetical protein